MFLLLGTTIRERVLVLVAFICEFCHTEASQQVIESATKFSLFFVPLFTISKRHYVVCTNCGGATALTKEQATHGIEWAQSNRQVG